MISSWITPTVSESPSHIYHGDQPQSHFFHDTSLLKTQQKYSLSDKVKSKLHKCKHLHSLAPALSPDVNPKPGLQ